MARNYINRFELATDWLGTSNSRLFVVKMNKIPAYLLLVSKENIEVIKTYSNVLTFYVTHFNAEFKTLM